MKIQKKYLVVLSLLLCSFLTGCGAASNEPNFTTGKNMYSGTASTEQPQEDNVTAKTDMGGLYVITDIDTQSEVLTLMKAENGKLVEHAYTGGTHFYNKYGDIMSVARLKLGQVIQFQTAEETDALTVVQISADAWEKENVKKYSFDAQNGMLTMGGSNYALDEDTKYFSDAGQIMVSAIGKEDALRVTGVDKKVLAVSVTTGHGEIVLNNTGDFNGGYVSLSGASKYYYEITERMTLEVPEGDYELTVANEGYGGSTQITVQRDQSTNVDVSALKGSEPKSCMITFTTIAPETTVLLDGKQVDISQPVTVLYGNHSLQAAAIGYDVWSRSLVVNSQNANIIIDLTKSAEDEETETAAGTESIAGDTEQTPQTGADSSAEPGTAPTGTTSTGTAPTGTTSTGTTSSGTTSSGTTSTGTTSTGTTSTGTTSTGTTSTGTTSTGTTSTGTTSSGTTSSGTTSTETTSNKSNTNDPTSSRSTATDAYLDTLSGIIDTLTGTSD